MVLIMVLNSQITLIKVFIFNNLKRKYGGQTVRISICPVEAQKVYFIAYFECSSTSNCLV